KTMLDTTLEVIKAALRADNTVTPADRTRLVAILRSGAQAPQSAPAIPEPVRIVRRKAQRLSCSLRLIDKLAVQGVLPRQTFNGRTRSCGFRSTDIDRSIAGGGLNCWSDGFPNRGSTARNQLVTRVFQPRLQPFDKSALTEAKK